MENQERSHPISRAEIEHIANLAYIGLRSDEIDQLAGDLSRVLEHVDRIHGLDTDDVPPTWSAVPLENVTRPDTVKPSWPVESVLSNAPEVDDNCFQVPGVLE